MLWLLSFQAHHRTPSSILIYIQPKAPCWNRLSTLELEWSDVELMFMLMLGCQGRFLCHEDSDGGIDKWSCPAGSCDGKVLRPMLCSASVEKLSGVVSSEP